MSKSCKSKYLSFLNILFSKQKAIPSFALDIDLKRSNCVNRACAVKLPEFSGLKLLE